jgi:transcriptional regulator with XRE-family HTH domain
MWELDMKQEGLAKAIGATRGGINKIVNGVTSVPVDKLETIAVALNTTVIWLCTDHGIDGDGYLKALATMLRENHFDVEIFNTCKEAANYIAGCCEGKSIGYGDKAVSIRLGVLDIIEKRPNEGIFSLDIKKGREDRKKAMNANIFLATVDGISYKTGEMLILDYKEGKIAGTLCADEIIFVVSKNRISPDFESAIRNIKEVVAIEKVREHKKTTTPCFESGKCGNCDSSDRFCRVMCTYCRKPYGTNMTVVLINEELK